MLKKTARAALIFVAFIALWQGIVTFFHLPIYILPTPFQVLNAIFQYHTVLLQQTWPTLLETILGLLIGIVFGCSVALIMILFRHAKLWLLPILIISQAIPTFAIAPLLVIWLGYGMASKIAVTVIMLFFPITSSFYDGLRCTNPAWLDMAKTMNAPRFKQLFHVQLPAALPSFVSGLRVAATIAPIGAVVGEWVGASQGLGFLMLNANARMQIDLMFAALIFIILWSLLLYFSIDKLMQVLVFWK